MRARRAWDFALAGAALAVEFDGPIVKKARVVLSGVAPVPWRAEEVEEVITGKRFDAELASRAAKAAVKDAEPMEKNNYKIPLLQGVVEEEIIAMAEIV